MAFKKLTKKQEKKVGKIKGELNRILSDLRDLNKDIGDTGGNVSRISKDVEDIKKDIQQDIGKDVDNIKVHVTDIKKDIGKDVDSIRDEIHDIKEDLDLLQARKGFFERLKLIPEKFGMDDLAQQLVGALVIAAPFGVTEEVWMLSNNLSMSNLISIILITILFDVLLFKYAKFKSVDLKNVGFLPLRIISLLFVAYSVTALMLFVFGVLGGQVTQLLWGVKLVSVVGLFANIGAGTADLIR